MAENWLCILVLTSYFPQLRGVSLKPTNSMCYPLVPACHGGITLRGDIELSKDSKALLEQPFVPTKRSCKFPKAKFSIHRGWLYKNTKKRNDQSNNKNAMRRRVKCVEFVSESIPKIHLFLVLPSPSRYHQTDRCSMAKLNYPTRIPWTLPEYLLYGL